MTHDYKHYAQPKPGPMPIPLWIWIFAIIVIGGFAGLLYYLDLYNKGRIGTDHEQNLKKILSQQLPVVTAKSKTTATTTTATDNKTENTKPEEKATSFDFYSLLPAMKVIIPDREVAVTDAEIPKHTTTSTIPYILQAGSFKDPQQADRLKAGLALIGIESSIESVSIKESGTWHRVRIGPYTNMNEIEKIRSRMRANHIDPILLRDKS